MHILGQTPVTPFEAMLIQLITRSLPGERTDIKAAKASTLAKVIVAEMTRRQMVVMNTGDIVGIQRDYCWTFEDLAAVAKSEHQITAESLQSFAQHVAVTIGEHGLAQLQKIATKDEKGTPASGVRLRVDLIIPGYAEFKARAEKMNAPAGAA